MKVEAIKIALERTHHRVWFDKEYMRGEMDPVMETAVRRCAVFVACVTDGYFRRKPNGDPSNSLKEFLVAKQHRTPGKDFIIIRLESDVSDFDEHVPRRVASWATYDLSTAAGPFSPAASAMVDRLQTEIQTFR